MRYDIMKFDKIIGHVNIDCMDVRLLKALTVLGYKVQLKLISEE